MGREKSDESVSKNEIIHQKKESDRCDGVPQCWTVGLTRTRDWQRQAT